MLRVTCYVNVTRSCYVKLLCYVMYVMWELYAVIWEFWAVMALVMWELCAELCSIYTLHHPQPINPPHLVCYVMLCYVV